MVKKEDYKILKNKKLNIFRKLKDIESQNDKDETLKYIKQLFLNEMKNLQNN